jgi:hypothetical protein
MTARLTRADARGLPRYLPLGLDKGCATGSRTRSRRRPRTTSGSRSRAISSKFPFADPRQGTFVVAIKAKNGALDYADGWPPLSDVDADVRFENTKLVIDATARTHHGAQIGPTKVTIDNLAANVPHLVVDGEASGPTAEFLQFVKTSPVAGLDQSRARHRAVDGQRPPQAALRPTARPGRQDDRSRRVHDVGNQLRMPACRSSRGSTARSASARPASPRPTSRPRSTAGPAKLSIASIEGGVRVNGRGTANLVAARSDLPELVADRVTARPTGRSCSRRSRAARSGRSTRRCAARRSTCPRRSARSRRRDAAAHRAPPDARGTSDTLNRRDRARRPRARRAPARERDRDRRARARAARQGGGHARANDRAGIWVHGDLPSFNLDDWLALKTQVASRGKSATTGPTLRGVDLEATMLQAFGRKFNDVKVSARSTSDDWKLQMTTREIAGTADWRAATPQLPNGRLVARLQRMSVPDEGELTPWQGADPAKARGENEANPWPELDVKSDALMSKGRNLGRFEVVARPQATDWRIEKMLLASDAGQIQAEGWWRAAGKTQQTRST